MAAIEQSLPRPSLRVFGLVWFGQLVSLIGSGLTGFALGVWVYQQTGSATRFALISVFASLPGIFLSPIAGTLADRWDRRWAMILSDASAAFSTLCVWFLLTMGWLEIWHIYVAVAFNSTFSAIQWPAYSAATTLLVPKKHFGRASGMVQMGLAASHIISPTLAGALIATIKIQGVILIDIVTFLFALFTLFIVRFPKPKATAAGEQARGSFWHEIAYSWSYVRARHGLLGLLLFFAAINLTLSMVIVLITPLVLSFTSEKELGVVLSVAGIGMLLGGLVMSVWGGPRRRINGILGFTLLSGLILFLGGLQPNTLLVAGAAFLFLFSSPIITGSAQAIWQSKVEPDIQGRVFAIRRVIGLSTAPIAYLLAGPLADKVFEPLLAAEGALANSVGQVIGTGPGRGIGLLFIILGILTVLTTIAGYSYPRLRAVENELPDIDR